jgi:hypothetical protein
VTAVCKRLAQGDGACCKCHSDDQAQRLGPPPRAEPPPGPTTDAHAGPAAAHLRPERPEVPLDEQASDVRMLRAVWVQLLASAGGICGRRLAWS